MSQTASIVIVSLCALVNVDNGDKTILPPPALVIPRVDRQHGGVFHEHTAFFAWNSKKVKVTGASPIAVKPPASGATDFFYFPVDGEYVSIKDNTTLSLTLSAFSGLAEHSKIWRTPPATKNVDSRFIPKEGNRLGMPDDNFDALYMNFATGTLTASRPTPVVWIFKDNQGETNRGTYNREAIYIVDAKEDGGHFAYLEIILHDLGAALPDRTVTFTALYPNTPIEIFLGNETAGGMYYAVERKEPPARAKGDHFNGIHQFSNTGVMNKRPIPIPITALPMRPGGDSTGYCGPLSLP